MAGQEEDDDLRMALRMSMQHQPPEPKRSKPFDSPAAAVEESPDVKSRRLQRELMAAAAEKRMLAAKPAAAKLAMPVSATSASASISGDVKGKNLGPKDRNLGRRLSEQEVNQLFSMLFGSGVSKDILAQWTNQGIRFSPDQETSMGLVQHEGGPCGVLAAVQAFVLKYLLFFPDELGKCAPNMTQSSGSRRLVAPDDFSMFTEGEKARALVRSMAEILFLCGNNRRAVVATLNVNGDDIEGSGDSLSDEIDAKALEGIQIETASDLVKILRVEMHDSRTSALQRLEAMIPVYESRMGAMLFLISALVSRGLDSVQADRDDPSQPLVTAPFGHASQEIVNLLLCGEAVPNVFDGRMDLGGGMFLKGISSGVEVGFLTLLESLNFCKVGRNLKCPKWPIWVIGSESHYTVLFALDTTVQDENELEERESKIRRAFDAQDQSGGGGFISVEGFSQVLRDTNVNLPPEKLDHLTSTGFIVWSEFWQVILDLDKSLGGLKDSTVSMGKKLFDLYHFNGIAKSVLNGNQASSGGDTPVQRPRLTKLRVSVPPRWTPEEFMSISGGKDTEMAKPPEPPQHAPLVDCIRTRWPRALCNWLGDPPSIV